MMEDQIKPEPDQKNGMPKWLWWAVGGGCVLLFCVAIVVILALTVLGPAVGKTFSGINTQVNFTPQVSPPDSGISPQTNDNSMGDPNAPVKMTLFSDFQCPYCRNFWQSTQPQIIETYVKTGKVQFTYRSAGNWVSQNMGRGSVESENAAMAAYCAGDQNKFWQYHDTLFNNLLGEDAGSFTDGHLQSFAKDIGLDTNQFNSCYSSRKYAERVNQDLKDATAAGIQGTPFFVITYTLNGQAQTQKIDGAQPFEAFQKVLDAALGK